MDEGSTTLTAVIGVGRMGRHHARTYRKLPEATLTAVVDANEERAATVADEVGCDFCTSVEQLLDRYPQVRAVTVAVPTIYHRQVAQPLLDRGIACLVEKPLAPTVADARALAEHAKARGVVLQVGHTERFNPAVRALDRMNLAPRMMEVHRVSPMTFRSMDVSVIMDMMIHDLDIVLMLAGCGIASVEATGVAILGEHEDIAHARLVFENGCVANITASRLAFDTHRRLRIFSETTYVSLDYQKRSGIVIRRTDNEQQMAELRQRLAAGEDLSNLDYSQLIRMEPLTMELPEGEDDPLTAELASFLRAVRTGQAPKVDGTAGYAAVEAAERVMASVRSHVWTGLAAPKVW